MNWLRQEAKNPIAGKLKRKELLNKFAQILNAKSLVSKVKTVFAGMTLAPAIA